jgi:hypothetical protein
MAGAPPEVYRFSWSSGTLGQHVHENTSELLEQLFKFSDFVP